MAEKDTIFTGKVKQGGLFDFKELYRFCYVWLVDHDYFVTEKVYSEKVGAGGKEIEIEWEAKRKISDYFRFTIKVNWRIIGLNDAEAEDKETGKKVKLNKGNVELKVAGVLEMDYESKWESSPFLKFMRGIYDRYVIRVRIDQYEGKIFGECDEFLAQARAFLAIEGKR
jgi:hypothetical protein